MTLRSLTCALTFGAIAIAAAAAGSHAAPRRPALMASPGPSPQASASASPGPMDALAWRYIGPTLGGGRLAAVAGSDRDPSLAYIGSAGGGVWKTTNAMTTWTPVFDKEPVAAIGAIAVSSRAAGDVWVGTGEGNPRNDVSYGDGIYRSRDAGASWKHLGLDKTYAISKIALDPRDPSVAVVAALGDPFHDSSERGVYRTRDGGKTWQRTLFLGMGTGAADLSRSARTPNVVFAAMWQFRRSTWHLWSGGVADGLYKSGDGGITWRRVAGGGWPATITGRIGVAVAPSDPRRVYALVESNDGILWRSDDGGAHWRLTSRNTLIDERPFYYTRIFVDPHDENHLFATSVRLAQSKDGGRTWQLSGKHLHGDHHDVWFSRDGKRVFDGDDGGIGISHDNGATWEWRNNVPIGQAYRIGLDRREPYTVCAGLQDNGSWCGPSDDRSDAGILARDWTLVGASDGTWTEPDPIDPDIIWSASGGNDNGGNLLRYDRRTRLGVDISPYQANQNVVAPAELRYRFNWESPLVFSPADGHVAYYGGNVVLRTGDGGQHWKVISPDLTRDIKARQVLSGTPLRLDVTGAETYDTILSIAASSLERGELWVSTDDGRIALTRDDGVHWSDVTVPGSDADARIPAIVASQRQPGTAYAVVDRHFTGDRAPYLWVTSDYGRSWRSIVGGLPRDQYVRAICEDARVPGMLFAGLENSVWWSDDGGATWRSLQQNLPPTSVRDLRIAATENDLVAGTHGRGIWILDDVTPLEAFASADRESVFFAAPRPARQAELNTPTVNPVGSGDGPPGRAIFTYYLPRRAKALPTLDVFDANDRIVRHLTPAEPRDPEDETKPTVSPTNVMGFNRATWDLTGDRPVPWYRAPSWNRGPDAGADLLPGRYVVALTVDGRAYRQPLTIAPDSRATQSSLQREAHVAYQSALIDALSRIDVALNLLDNVELQLPQRLATLRFRAATPKLVADGQRVLDRARRIAGMLSSHPQNGQDNDFLRDLLRERIVALLAVTTTLSPTAEQTRESAALLAEIDRALQSNDAFVRDDLMPLQTALAAAGVSALDLAARPAKPDPKTRRDQFGERREAD